MIFDISIDRRSAELAVVAVSGDFDLHHASHVRSELVELIDDGVRELVVDMTETTFLDSTAIGALVGALKRMRASDGEVNLVCADRSIVRIFRITGLDQVFNLHRALDDALALHPLSLA